MQKILEQIAVTAELMGQAITPTAAAMMANDFSVYPENFVIEALTILRRESKGRFSLAAVIEQIEKINPDGRPCADEAWAMIPRNENDSAVMTDEMSQALGIAQSLLNEGDQVAARMAFKEAYTRLVEKNKRNGVNPKWFPSLGFDKHSHMPVLEEAVRLNRLSIDHASGLLSPDDAIALIEMQNDKLAIEHKTISPEEAKLRLAQLKELINQSKLGVNSK